jgi:flagellar hook protein FlgE
MDASFVAPLSGMRVTQVRQDVVGHNVANINTQGYEERNVIQKEDRPSGVSVAAITKTPNTSPTGESNTDLPTAMTGLLTNKNTYGANARVIKVQDRMLGEIIDLVR